MKTLERFKHTQFAQEVDVLRYALIGKGGSQLILLFEAEVDGFKKCYMSPIDSEMDPEKDKEKFSREVFRIIDKDLGVTLKYADQIFKNAELDRKNS